MLNHPTQSEPLMIVQLWNHLGHKQQEAILIEPTVWIIDHIKDLVEVKQPRIPAHRAKCQDAIPGGLGGKPLSDLLGVDSPFPGLSLCLPQLLVELDVALATTRHGCS